MRRLLHVSLVPLVGVALILGACIDPQDRRPGLRLSGEVVQSPIDDWSFSDDHGEIFIELPERPGGSRTR